MLRASHARRSLALGAALVMTTWGAAAVPASAEPGSGKSGQHAKSGGQSGKAKGNGGNGGKGNAGKSTSGKGNAGQGNSGQGAATGQGQGGGKSNAGGQGNSGGGNSSQGNGSQGSTGGTSQGNAGGNGQGGGKGNGGSQGDPGGNNGTVKIAPLGEMDGIPNNSPHPGCTFQVEWYGFDEGDDIVSTVGFAMHSPTKDVGLNVAGDTSVFVGGDPASGAGTDTGLDGTEVYTLSFDGEPHPQQGYHVKLTVHTPRSNGNDSKTKVFWVEPCQPTPGDTDTEDGDGVTPGTDDGTEPGSVEDETTPDSDIEVLGEEATDEDGDSNLSPAEAEAEAGDQSDALAGAQAGAQAGSEDGSVPTAVDAGDNGRSALDWVRSPLPLLVIALGAVLAAAALVTRRRTRVQAGE